MTNLGFFRLSMDRLRPRERPVFSGFTKLEVLFYTHICFISALINLPNNLNFKCWMSFFFLAFGWVVALGKRGSGIDAF